MAARPVGPQSGYPIRSPSTRTHCRYHQCLATPGHPPQQLCRLVIEQMRVIDQQHRRLGEAGQCPVPPADTSL